MPEKATGITIIYDGDCPFCSRFSSMIRLREALGPVTLVNARDGGPDVERVVESGLDLDDGMAMIIGDKIHHGADCLNRIALMTTPSTIINKVNGMAFRSRLISRLAYPLLRSLRNMALRGLGRHKIGDCDKQNS